MWSWRDSRGGGANGIAQHKRDTTELEIFLAITTPIYSFSLVLPTGIFSLGYSSVIAQLFTVPLLQDSTRYSTARSYLTGTRHAVWS